MEAKPQPAELVGEVRRSYIMKTLVGENGELVVNSLQCFEPMQLTQERSMVACYILCTVFALVRVAEYEKNPHSCHMPFHCAVTCGMALHCHLRTTEMVLR